MKIEKTVCLKKFSDVEKIVSEAEKCDFYIRAVRDNTTINVKSFLAMISLITGRTATIQFEAENAERTEFYRLLNQYSA